MTQITQSEIKIVYFALIFSAVIGFFVYAYSQNPIQNTYNVTSQTQNQTSATSEDSWISGILGVLPAPFNDPYVVLIFGVFVFPITIMLGYISIRAIKDLVSQWI